jgi:hypothetical protein
MANRDELHQLVEEVPENRVEQVLMMLRHHVHPPEVRPEIEQSRRQLEEFRRQVEGQFRATRKPGTISSMGGSGFVGRAPHGGGFSNKSFHYWDDRAIVYQSLRSYSDQIMESMERLSTTPDDSAFVYEVELSSGGRIVRYREEFPRVKIGA